VLIHTTYDTVMCSSVLLDSTTRSCAHYAYDALSMQVPVGLRKVVTTMQGGQTPFCCSSPNPHPTIARNFLPFMV
jgi:hypothetical protein